MTDSSEENPMSSPSSDSPKRLTPARVTVQIIGFAIGLAVLIWCINNARRSGNLEVLNSAGWRDVLPLIGCTCISFIANGAIFWALIRPVQSLGLIDLQLVNCVVNLLNYAPVRLGLITRLAYHRRVDGLSYLMLVAWYAAFALLYFVMLGCLIAASVLRPQFDVIWCGIFFGLLIIAGAAVWYVSQHHLITSRLRGADRLLAYPMTMALAMGLRLIDVAAYVGRLHYSFELLETKISLHDTITLALISMVGNLSPVGALGIREGAVAYFGPTLTSPDLADQVNAAILIDRAAEAVVFVPLGLIAVCWMIAVLRRRPSA
ncbi:MAG: hypothetical protein HND57_01200 [Planctomycetes bacterium]|nr:hypothetical protein [Planctomycetota bacterium]